MIENVYYFDVIDSNGVVNRAIPIMIYSYGKKLGVTSLLSGSSTALKGYNVAR